MINQQGCDYILPENRISCLNLVMWLITILSTVGVSSAVISNDWWLRAWVNYLLQMREWGDGTCRSPHLFCSASTLLPRCTLRGEGLCFRALPLMSYTLALNAHCAKQQAQTLEPRGTGWEKKELEERRENGGEGQAWEVRIQQKEIIGLWSGLQSPD